MRSPFATPPDSLRGRYNAWHGLALADPSHVAEEARFFAWVLELLRAAPARSLLDVACGTGKFAAHVAATTELRVVGVDLSDVAVEAARERVPEAEFLVADGQALPFVDGAFDHATCLGSLEHFPEPGQGAAEICRVLRPGGTAVVFVPNLFFLGHVWFGLRHGTQPTEGGQGFSEAFRTSNGWRELLEDGGLEVIGVRPWNRIHASTRVRPPVRRLWNTVAPLVPLNASYGFGFVCTRR